MTIVSKVGDLILGIDAGGTTSKAALFDLEGRCVDVSRRPFQTNVARGGVWIERDPAAMWLTVAQTVSELLQRDTTRPGRILAVCATGFGGGLLAVDKSAAPIGPMIMSADRRAAKQARDLNSGTIGAAVRENLGISMWSSWSLSLFRWIEETGTSSYRDAAALLWCKDFIRLQLTGEIATDATDAATAGLLDLETQTYAIDLIEATTRSNWRSLLPEIRPANDLAGHVAAEASHATGLLPGTPVIVGCVDLASCAMASGVVSPGHISVIAGTWSINQVVLAPNVTTKPLPMTAYRADHECDIRPRLDHASAEVSPDTAGTYYQYPNCSVPGVALETNAIGRETLS